MYGHSRSYLRQLNKEIKRKYEDQIYGLIKENPATESEEPSITSLSVNDIIRKLIEKVPNLEIEIKNDRREIKELFQGIIKRELEKQKWESEKSNEVKFALPAHWKGYDERIKEPDNLMPVLNRLRPNTEADVSHTWYTAGDIANQFYFNLNEPNVDDVFPPMSNWHKEHVATVHAFFEPVEQFDLVIPREYMPIDQEMQHLECIFDPRLDKNALSNEDLDLPDSIPLFSAQRMLMTQLIAILQHDEFMANMDVPREEEMKQEKIYEVYSDNIFRLVAVLAGIGDRKLSSISLLEQQPLTCKLGSLTISGSIEFMLKRNHHYPFFVWVEDKQFRTSKSFADLVSQKVAETLTIAVHNYALSGTPTAKSTWRSQEVFGVSVRHTYFTFWHAAIPALYLKHIIVSPSRLSEFDFFKLKCFPVSQFGLDICNPVDRRKIFSYLIAISRYIQASPKVGEW